MPSKVCTFLFTDIEGSTKRWDAYPDAMRVALEAHDHLLRSVCEAHQGHVFKTVGDAFCVAFENPVEGVVASLMIQSEIAARDWSTIDGLRVRMGLHMGAADLRDNDYFGPALNRVARIQSLAYGAQVLISSAVFEVIKDPLRQRVHLVDLGTHRLKDLAQREQIFQISAIDKEVPHFPPLKSLDHHPNNLPAQPTSFIGREREIQAVQDLLTKSGARLVTLTGPGGIGKSRLSLQVAAELLEQFGDGVFFVPLAEIEEPDLVPATIAQLLGVAESLTLPIQEVLLRYLQQKQLLLVLDNLEQVVDAASYIAQILQRAPRVKVLVSSRIVLEIYGEQEFPLRQLGRPTGAVDHSVEELLMYESVQLFVERAKAARPSFQLDDENATAVATLCRHLDGLPLAIELAAARVKMFTPQAMLPRLTASLDLLTGGARNLPERQRTLRGAINWSYSLLTLNDQRLFEALSVFSGSFTFEAVEAVIAPVLPDQIDIFDGLASLLNKSLIQQDMSQEETRFSLLAPLRAYALEKRVLHPWANALGHNHAHYFIELLDELKTKLGDMKRSTWVEAVERDYDNLRAALQWTFETGERALALRLCCSLPTFWEAGKHRTEGRQWLKDTLALPEPDVVGYEEAITQQQDQLQALIIAGSLAEWQGDYGIARTYYHSGLALADEHGAVEGRAMALQNCASVEYRCGNYDLALQLLHEALTIWQSSHKETKIAHVLHQIGNILYRQGRLDEAKHHYEDSLQRRRAVNDKRGMAASLNNLGTLAQRQGRLEDAFLLLSESLEIQRASGERASVAILLNNLGTLARRCGDMEKAQKHFQESLALKRAMGDKAGMAYSLNGMGNVCLASGHLDEARDLFLKSLHLTFEIGDKWGFSTCLADLARVEAMQENRETALILVGAVQAIQEQIGATLTQVEFDERQAWLSPLCHSAGERCEPLIQRGATLTIEQAMALAQTPLRGI
jgi:predicted ATPase/class 3 adenylate cyclase/Tfp pilus assembly protein PilF